MTSKQKTEYIWEYYKFHIIGSILLIAFVTSFVVDVMRSKETVLNITLLGNVIVPDKIEELQNKATSELVNDPKNKQEIRFDFLIKTDDMKDQYSIASMQKLQASVAAAEVDIMIMDKKDFEIYASQGMFMKLKTIPVIDKLNLPNDAYLKHKVTETDTEEEVYGINVENMSILKDIGYDTKNKVLCVVANTKRLSMVEKFFPWFFNQKSV